MRLELGQDNKIVETNALNAEKSSGREYTGEKGGELSQEAQLEEARKRREEYKSVSDEIKEQKAKFRELDFRGKINYIWDYYKWFIIIGIFALILLRVFVRDYIDNSRPTYLDAVFINSNFAFDNTNTLEADYINQYKIDLDTYHLYIDTGMNLSQESFDTMIMANQQKLMSMYAAQDLDVVVGPVEIMEGAANSECFADLSKLLPQDLIDELIDRDYEFYYYDPMLMAKERAVSDAEIDGKVLTIDDIDVDQYQKEDPYFGVSLVTGSSEPYFAGIYLDNCSYLNNNGEYGAYDVAEDAKDRPILIIPGNSTRSDKAIEFVRFLVENR